MMKNKMVKLISFLLLLCLLTSAVACAKEPASPDGALTPEELGGLQNGLIEQEKKEEEEKEKEEEKKEEGKEQGDQNDDEQKDPAPQPTEDTVYWLKSGSVYHSHATCSYLAGKDNVNQGTADEAVAAGKQKLCSRCAKEDG